MAPEKSRDFGVAANAANSSSLKRRSFNQLKHNTPGLEDDPKTRDGIETDDGESAVVSERRGLSLLNYMLISAVVCIIYFYWRLQPEYAQQSSPIRGKDDKPDGNKLELVLHPKQHIYREPQEIKHQWYISSGKSRPDGVLKETYLINGEFLGPTIECRSGDTIIVEIENGLVDEGIAIHWHGLHMRGANDMDGAVGMTQDPIRPGANFTYRFKVSDHQHGTFWYHAHEGVQRQDGMFGPLVVHQPVETLAGKSEADLLEYDEERLLLVGDWYHRDAQSVLSWYMRAASFGNEPVPDSLLINGIGAYNCSQAVRARPVDCQQGNVPGLLLEQTKSYRIRIVNVGNLAGFNIDLSAGTLLPIFVDGGSPISGQKAKSVGIIYPGQRVDVIYNNGNTKTAQILITMDDESFKYQNRALDQEQAFPLSLVAVTESTRAAAIADRDVALDHFDIEKARSDANKDIPEHVNTTLVIYSTSVKMAHLQNAPHGFMNHTSWKPQETPPGHLLGLPRTQWDKNQFVPLISVPPSAASNEDDAPWVDIILNNLDDGSHPFHLHGYDAYVIQSHAGFGWGSWNPFENLEPPGGPLSTSGVVRRDTFFVPKRGYTVLRFKAANMGIWMLHCHLLVHQASGMAMGLEIGQA